MSYPKSIELWSLVYQIPTSKDGVDLDVKVSTLSPVWAQERPWVIGSLLVVILDDRAPTVTFYSFSAQPGPHWNVLMVKKKYGKPWLVHVQ